MDIVLVTQPQFRNESDFEDTFLFQERAISNASEFSRGDDGISIASDSVSQPIVKLLDLSKFEDWTQRNFWSCRNKVWSEFIVLKPRLPKEGDGAEKWHEKYRPDSLDDFCAVPGNEPTFQALNDFLEKRQFRSLIICGPVSSGKSSVLHVYLREQLESRGVDTSRDPSLRNTVLWFSEKDSQELRLSEMEYRLEAFCAIKVKNALIKAVVFEGICTMPPKNQQNVKKLMDDNDENLRFFFTCFEPRKIIANIKQRAFLLKLNPMAEGQRVRFVLSVCVRERVGFEREGLEEIYTKHRPDLKAILDNIQLVFIKKQFLSKYNVCAQISPEKLESLDKATISDIAALQPLERCEICTLPRPCHHHPYTVLQAMAEKHRAELPQNPDMMDCPSFLETGACKYFNRSGHCSLHHPMNKHIIVREPRRCQLCTLPVPCAHCRYFKEKEKLHNFAVAFQKEIRARQKQIDEAEFNTLLAKVEQITTWLKNTKSLVDVDYLEKSKWLKKYHKDMITRFPLVHNVAVGFRR